MTSLPTQFIAGETNITPAENQKGIDNHRIAAKHHEDAAKHHLDAAEHHKAGNHEKASESTIKAIGHHYLAGEAQREDAKQHSLYY